MLQFFALFLICLVAAIAIACAINFFMRIGAPRSFGYALFAVGFFLFFGATGLSEGASRHAWGPLTAVFMLMLAGGWLSIKFGKKAWEWWREKNSKGN